MAKKSFKKLFIQNFAIIIFSINIVFGIIIGLIARNYQINKSLELNSHNIDNSIIEINKNLETNQNKISILSEIILSQINNPRAFYDINSLFKNVLSSNTQIKSILITLSPNSIFLNRDLYNFRDSLGRFSATWKKNFNNIIFVDSVHYFNNNFYYQTIKNNPQTTMFKSKIHKKPDNIYLTKTIVSPLFDGTHFVGILGYSFSSNFIENNLNKYNIAKNSFVTDEKGIVLFNSENKISLGKDFTNIIKKDFKDKEKDIIHNNDFVEKNNGKLLIFKSFKTISGKNWKIGTIIPAKKIYRTANLSLILIILFFVVFSFFLMFLMNLLTKKGLKVLNLFNNNIKEIKNGKINTKIEVPEFFTEINTLKNNLDNLRLRLLKLTEVHHNIENQKLKQKLKSYGDDDIIATSINNAIDAIEKRAEKRQKALESEKKNDWINEGLNLLHEAARVTDNSLEALTDKINQKISIYTNAFLSAIFIYNQDQDNKNTLSAVSTFGIDKKRAFKKNIQLGEGVVGSVAQEKKTQYFDKVPDDYQIIVGGLSEMKPKSILVQTLSYEGEFFGILEIAFLRKLQKFELDFFQAASAEIALSVKNLLGNIETDKLLEKMKVQTTEIEKTKEELQTKIDVITEKEKESLENQAAMQSMINAVNNTLMTIEYTTKGILLTANEKYLRSMHYTLEELQGVNVLELVKSERDELQQVINKVSKGQYYDKIMKRFTKYGEVKWLYSTYTPYYDAKGKITKILYFAFDVTETKKYTEKLEKEISILKKQVKILREKI